MQRQISCTVHLGKQKPYAGLVAGEKLKAGINELPINPNLKVQDLKIHFLSISARLIHWQANVPSEGFVGDIIRASTTLPFLVPIDCNLYVHGGIRNNLSYR